MALKLGELLKGAGLLTDEQLKQALVAQKSFGGKLGTNLVELGFITELALAQFLSKQLNFPSARPQDFAAIPKSIIDLIPQELAKAYRVVPLREEKKKLLIAFSDPNDLQAVDELTFKIGKGIQPIIAPEIWITAALERYYNIVRNIRFSSFEEEGPDPEPGVAGKKPAPELDALAVENYVTKLLQVKTKDDVFAALLDVLLPFYPRLAVYVVRKDTVCGWVVRGFALHDRDFQKIQVPYKEKSAVHEVLESQTPFIGVNPTTQGDLRLTYNLWIPANTVVEIRPISFRGKGVAAILGVPEHENERTAIRRMAIIQLVFEKAGLAFEFGALRKSISDIRF